MIVHAVLITIVGCFILGQVINFWLKAENVARSERSGLESVGQYLSHYRAVLVARFLCANFGFMFVIGGIEKYSPLGEVALRNAPALFAIPAAFFIGFGVDNLLYALQDKLPLIKGLIPKDPLDEKQQAVAQAEGKSN